MNTNTLTILISSANAQTHNFVPEGFLCLCTSIFIRVQYKGVLFSHHNFDKDAKDQYFLRNLDFFFFFYQINPVWTLSIQKLQSPSHSFLGFPDFVTCNLIFNYRHYFCIFFVNNNTTKLARRYNYKFHYL